MGEVAPTASTSRNTLDTGWARTTRATATKMRANAASARANFRTVLVMCSCSTTRVCSRTGATHSCARSTARCPRDRPRAPTRNPCSRRTAHRDQTRTCSPRRFRCGSFPRSPPPSEVGGPHAASQPVRRVVGDADRIFLRVVRDDRQLPGRRSPPGRSSSSCLRRRTLSAARTNRFPSPLAGRRRHQSGALLDALLRYSPRRVPAARARSAARWPRSGSSGRPTGIAATKAATFSTISS